MGTGLGADIIAATLVLLLAVQFPAQAGTYPKDGDDIIIDGQDYRLEGVDAFEPRQICIDGNGVPYDCGARAKAALSAIIAGQQVICTPTKRDRNRWIANCTVGARDVAEEIVRAGWAFVRPDFFPAQAAARLSFLCGVEKEAREQKAGAWAGSFDLPYIQKNGSKKTREEVSCPANRTTSIWP